MSMKMKKTEEEPKATYDEARSLSKSLLNKLEAERRYIARELHDEIGQALTALKISLQSLQRINDPEQFSKRLNDLITMLDRVLNQVRNMSLNLRPSLIDDLGLAPTVRWYVDRISATTGINIELSMADMDSRFELETEIACFRVIQEAINNAIRHAKADKIEIKLEKDKEHIQLSIFDNGCGFNVAKTMEDAKRGKSFGLIAMKERVELTHGRIEISSEYDKGTFIRVSFPINRS